MTEVAPAPWYQGVEGVDAELTGHIQTKGWDKLTPQAAAAQAAKAHRESERLVGAPADQVVRLPKDPNDVAGWKTVWERLGAPKDATGYDFSTVKTVDGKAPEAAVLDFVRDQATKLNMSKDAAARLAESLVRQSETQATTAKAEYDANLTKARSELAKSWGPNAEGNKFIAGKAAAVLGITPELMAELEKGVGYNKVMEMFLSIGQKIGEDKFISGGGPAGTVLTADQAKARLTEIKADTAWTKRYFEGGTAEKREFEALTTLIANSMPNLQSTNR